MLLLFGAVVFISGTDPKKLKDFINKTINQTNFKFMEKKILYHIGLYGFRKLIVYVIKDNGDNISIVSLNKDGSFPNTFGTVICIT
jgi:hypothetical protein